MQLLAGKLRILAITAIFAGVSISLAYAQTVPSTPGLTLDQSSDNPLPGQTVTITATSYSFDINSATIIWSVNGKSAGNGVGLTTIQVTAPDLGKKTVISAKATTQDGVVYSNSLTIGSGSVDMIIETDGYVPPFFLGKTPIAFQNDVTVIAIPHIANSAGKEYDPSTLVYQWKKDDGTVLQSQSGYGKESITMPGNIVPRPYYLIVTASSLDGSAQAEGIIQITAASPTISFYNNDPLYGALFNTAAGANLYIGSSNEASIIAVPFGFNLPSGNINNLSFDWLINDTDHPELASDPSVILRAPDNAGGLSQVQVSVNNQSNILQEAQSSFSVTFTGGASTTAQATVNL